LKVKAMICTKEKRRSSLLKNFWLNIKEIMQQKVLIRHVMPYYVQYAAPRSPLFQKQPHVQKHRLEKKDRSRVQEKKNVLKQVYLVKKDGRKDKSSDLNSSNEKPLNVLKTSATNSKEKEQSATNILSAKSKQKKSNEPKIKKCCCPKLKHNQDAHLVYQIGKRRSYKGLCSRAEREEHGLGS
ncbi:hypothetical protein BAE44_0006695, partial [Dichanthelium oligosanthes]